MTNGGSADGMFVEGDATALVRVISYEDLQCGDCADYSRMRDEQLLPRFGQSVAFEHRDFPLAKHAWAKTAAVAARYFLQVKPELGAAFRRYCFQHYDAIVAPSFAQHVRDFAMTNGVDADRAVNALSDAALAVKVEADHREGIARGVVLTPTVFVRNKAFIETFSFEEISRAIESALEFAGARH